jgi:hypothetical protein
MDDIVKLEFDEQYKREIILNSRMVILSAELNKIRMRQKVDNDKRTYLLKLIDEIYQEYYELWCMRNYEKGVENYLTQLSERKKELLML